MHRYMDYWCGRVSRLAQLAERKTLNLVVVGSSPTVGILIFPQTAPQDLKPELGCIIYRYVLCSRHTANGVVVTFKLPKLEPRFRLPVGAALFSPHPPNT
jgi:hypothetical protein